MGVWLTIFVVGMFLFVFLLAAVATWEQKRRGPRADDFREVHGGTIHDSGFRDPGSSF
jgi:hypothetical protein